MTNIYVVVAENNKTQKMPSGKPYFDDGGPFVVEQYIRTADLESVKKRAKLLETKYGECRIARLEFVDAEREDEEWIY